MQSHTNSHVYRIQTLYNVDFCVTVGSDPHNDAGVQELFRWAFAVMLNTHEETGFNLWHWLQIRLTSVDNTLKEHKKYLDLQNLNSFVMENKQNKKNPQTTVEHSLEVITFFSADIS